MPDFKIWLLPAAGYCLSDAKAAQEATACRLRGAGLVLALEDLSDLCSEQGMEGSLTSLRKREVSWQLPSLMEGVCPKFLVWRHIFFPGPPGFCFSVRGPAFCFTFQLGHHSLEFSNSSCWSWAEEEGHGWLFQWNGAASSTRRVLFWMNSASDVGLIIFKSRTRLTRFFFFWSSFAVNW